MGSAQTAPRPNRKTAQSEQREPLQVPGGTPYVILSARTIRLGKLLRGAGNYIAYAIAEKVRLDPKAAPDKTEPFGRLEMSEMKEATEQSAREVQKIMKDALACGLIERLGKGRLLSGLYRLRYDLIDSTAPYEDREFAAEQRAKTAELRLCKKDDFASYSSRNSREPSDSKGSVRFVTEQVSPADPIVVFPGPRQPILLSQALAVEIARTRRITIETHHPLTVRYGSDDGGFFLALAPHSPPAAGQVGLTNEAVREMLQTQAERLFHHPFTGSQIGELRSKLMNQDALVATELLLSKKPRGTHSPGLLFKKGGIIDQANEIAREKAAMQEQKPPPSGEPERLTAEWWNLQDAKRGEPDA